MLIHLDRVIETVADKHAVVAVYRNHIRILQRTLAECIAICAVMPDHDHLSAQAVDLVQAIRPVRHRLDAAAFT